jgi:ABC-2 type transport system ATP-binding protein
MAAIQIDQVKKRFGTLQALGGVSLEIAEGEFFGLLGPNGADFHHRRALARR